MSIVTIITPDGSRFEAEAPPDTLVGQLLQAFLDKWQPSPAPPRVSVPAPARIFLSYARPDREKVENLYRRLSGAGFHPWMDTHDLLPGEVWKRAIRKAIRDSDFFLACLSPQSVSKRGVIQKEIKGALEVWEGNLVSDIYLIPVRLEDCEMPESLEEFQWVDLFAEDGWDRLVQALHVGMERRKPSLEEGPERVPQRHSLRPGSADHPPLDPSLTLREAGLTSAAPWVLTSEPLSPDSPVPLMVEDEQGQRFVTAVLLNTRVGELAEAFLQQTQKPRSPGKPVVEWTGGLPSTGIRPLNLEATLYEEGVGDDARLRVYSIPESTKE
jgi:hypothetical protein